MRRRDLMIRLCAVMCLGLCGIAAGQCCDEDDAPDPEEWKKIPPEIQKLLADLNDNPTTSRTAQEALLAMGPDVEPWLVVEIRRYRDDKPRRYLSAARCLGLLERMNSDAAVPEAVRILKNVSAKPDTNEQPARVLQSQALQYLTDFFKTHPDAVAAVLYFAEERRKQWASEGVYLQGFSANNNGVAAEEFTTRNTVGWDLARDIPEKAPDRIWVEYERLRDRVGLWVNLYPALEQLVELDAPGIEPVLRKLLRCEPYVYCLCYEYLSDDGFSPLKRVFALPPESGEAPNWLEPHARPRMLLMDWAEKLHDTGAVKPISELLRSKHIPERKRALAAIEALHKKTPPLPPPSPDRRPPLPAHPTGQDKPAPQDPASDEAALQPHEPPTH